MTRKILGTTTLMIGLLASGASFADDAECSVPLSDWQPWSAVAEMAKARGWNVQRIKTDDGCYEIKARDGEGREVKAMVDPSTLRILRTEREDGEDANDDEGRRSERRGYVSRDDEDGDDEGDGGGYQAPLPGTDAFQAPTAAASPPAKGLFNGGTRPKAQVN